MYAILGAAGSRPAASTSTPRSAARASTADLFHAHIGALDALAQALLAAAALVEDGELAGLRDQRYAGGARRSARPSSTGGAGPRRPRGQVASGEIDPAPVTGAQERLRTS